MIHFQEDLVQGQAEGLGVGDPQETTLAHVLQEAPYGQTLVLPCGIQADQVVQMLPIPLLVHRRGDFLQEIFCLRIFSNAYNYVGFIYIFCSFYSIYVQANVTALVGV